MTTEENKPSPRGVRLFSVLNTYDVESGEAIYADPGAHADFRCYVRADKMYVQSPGSCSYEVGNRRNIPYEHVFHGKVIFKDLFLYIVESAVRIIIVHNNVFQCFNTQSFTGGPHSLGDFKVGDFVVVEGYINWNLTPPSVFSFKSGEDELPATEYLWKGVRAFKIINMGAKGELSDWQEVQKTDSRSNHMGDDIMHELECICDAPIRTEDYRWDPYPELHNGRIEEKHHITATGRIHRRTLKKEGKWIYRSYDGSQTWEFDYPESGDHKKEYP